MDQTEPNNLLSAQVTIKSFSPSSHIIQIKAVFVGNWNHNSMSITQFAMVEELAFLVKDNLPCKHFLLSLEEALVNFLENDSSSGGVLELEPMNPYNRLLAHRLAEIFGFAHQSVGDGEDRHLILERCGETIVPSILVSDLLWQFDGVQPPISHDVLRRDDHDSIQGQRLNVSSGTSVEDREAAYIAARERIFAGDTCEGKLTKEWPRPNPVVAQRMISHALGQSNKASLSETKSRAQTKNNASSLGVAPISSRNVLGKTLSSSKANGSKIPDSKVPQEGNKSAKSLTKGSSGTEDSNIKENYLRNEHLGAAKRLFANALGVQRRDVTASKCEERKKSIV